MYLFYLLIIEYSKTKCTEKNIPKKLNQIEYTLRGLKSKETEYCKNCKINWKHL